MSEINSAGGAGSILDQLNIQNKQAAEKKKDELGQAEFMKLLVAQLENQDPLQPQENGEFIAQLAQFSSLESIEKMSSKMDGLVTSLQSSQALQASALVGREVMVASDRTQLGDKGGITGAANLPASTSSLSISVYTEQGELVSRFEMGERPAGEVPFTWDARDEAGNAYPQGMYVFKAEALLDGVSEQVTTQLGANVDSVTVGQGREMTLNLAGLGSKSMNEVTQIF
jgi:flagellar basal-body rod modification protein FlgD